MKETLYALSFVDSEGKEILVNKKGEIMSLKELPLYASLENAKKSRKAIPNYIKKHRLSLSQYNYDRIIDQNLDLNANNNAGLVNWHLNNLLIIQNGLNIKEVKIEVVI